MPIKGCMRLSNSEKWQGPGKGPTEQMRINVYVLATLRIEGLFRPHRSH